MSLLCRIGLHDWKSVMYLEAELRPGGHPLADPVEPRRGTFVDRCQREYCRARRV